MDFKIMSWNINKFCGANNTFTTKDDNLKEIVKIIKDFFQNNENGVVILQEVCPKEKFEEIKKQLTAEKLIIKEPVKVTRESEKQPYFEYSEDNETKKRLITTEVIAVVTESSKWEVPPNSLFDNYNNYKNRIVELICKNPENENNNINILGVHMNGDTKFWEKLNEHMNGKSNMIAVGDFNVNLKKTGQQGYDHNDDFIKIKTSRFEDLVPEHKRTYKDTNDNAPIDHMLVSTKMYEEKIYKYEKCSICDENEDNENDYRLSDHKRIISPTFKF